MKKIPTLFERIFHGHDVVETTRKVHPGMEWVLAGEGVATVKWDGACCAIMNGVFYRRYDAKKGKKAPLGAVPCCGPDPITGHHPHWVLVGPLNPADKWFVEALKNYTQDAWAICDGTYEAVGPHFQGNPYGLTCDTLIRHGEDVVDVPRSYDGIKEYLQVNAIEGLVFWKDGEPQCKIKRSDFGYPWPVEGADHVE